MFHFAGHQHRELSLRNGEIDVLRGCAIILVLINHLSVAFVAPPALLSYLPIDGCSIGVALFFCISGYIITLTLGSELRRGYDLRAFYIRRVFRIMPLSILWVEFTLAGTRLLNVHGFFGDWAINSRAASWVLMMAANIGMRTETGGLGALGVFWSLSVEEQFYVLIPLLLLLNRRLLGCVVLLLLFVSICWADGPVAKDLYQFTPLLMGLLVGLILPRATVRRSAFGPAALRYLPWVALCGLPYAAGAALVSYRLYCGVYAVCALVVTAAALRQGWLLRPARLSNLLRYFGTRSYGLYLSHFAVSMGLRELWRSALDGGLPDSACAEAAMLISWLGVTLLVTEALHRWVELPMIVYGRRASDALRSDHLLTRRASPAVVEQIPVG